LPVSVLGEWSAQHLRVITASLTGSVLVVAPTHPSREPWASEIPDDAFRAASHVAVSPLDEVDTTARFDHIVVPFAAAVSVPIDALFRALESRLGRPGTIVALVPGPAYWNELSGGATEARGSDGASDLAMRARQQITQARVSMETFGNAVTAQAVAAGTPASEVDGVAIDLHDPRMPVMVALHLSVSDPDQHDARISRRREGTDGDRTTS
jgi:hypothetical protein